MTKWLRFELAGRQGFGTLEDDTVTEYLGDMFGTPCATGTRHALADLRLLTPCQPGKLIGLWNNFHARAVVEKLHIPDHPLYFLKSANSFAAHGEHIPRPPGYAGIVVYEGELGIVIGRRAAAVSVAEAPEVIFGYTCANDVTARERLRADPAFVHWTRAKCADRFGVFGPVIASGIDPAGLSVEVWAGGRKQQDYPVSDMIFSPYEIVSRLSHDMTLEPGDVIACGTSVGVEPMIDGETVEVVIAGIGRLSNVFGTAP